MHRRCHAQCWSPTPKKDIEIRREAHKRGEPWAPTRRKGSDRQLEWGSRGHRNGGGVAITGWGKGATTARTEEGLRLSAGEGWTPTRRRGSAAVGGEGACMGAVDEAYGGAVKEANNDAVEETGGDTFGEVEAAEEGQWGALAIVRRETRPPLEGSSLAKILGLPTGEVPWCRGEGVPRPPMVR